MQNIVLFKENCKMRSTFKTHYENIHELKHSDASIITKHLCKVIIFDIE